MTDAEGMMNLLQDPELRYVLAVMVALLLAATILMLFLGRKLHTPRARFRLNLFKSRLQTWWGIMLFTILILNVENLQSVILYALRSCGLLWEFLWRTSVRPVSVPAWVVCFGIVLPFQYHCVYCEWYALFTIFIPVFLFMVLPMVVILSGRQEYFLARTARLHWGLMIEVYFLSHLPALMLWEIPGYTIENAQLLLFLLILVELSDYGQELLGGIWGRKKIVLSTHPHLTWEGLPIAMIVAYLAGLALSGLTPFKARQAALIASLSAALGFLGRLCFAAVLHYPGGGAPNLPGKSRLRISERLASLCFAAPLYFHFVRYYLAAY